MCCGNHETRRRRGLEWAHRISPKDLFAVQFEDHSQYTMCRGMLRPASCLARLYTQLDMYLPEVDWKWVSQRSLTSVRTHL
jgi:hypothetical protein